MWHSRKPSPVACGPIQKSGIGGTPYPILTGDYSATPRWERRPLEVGTPIAKPAPVFTKLDPSVVDEELARLDPDSDAG